MTPGGGERWPDGRRTALEVVRLTRARALRRRVRRSARPVGIGLAYHGIADGAQPPAPRLVATPQLDAFRAQLEHVARHYRVVPASELLDAVAARGRGEAAAVAITFDDDLASHRRLAMPILLELGLPAAFFLSGASLDGPHAFWWERLQRLMDQTGQDPAALPPSIRALAGHRRGSSAMRSIARAIASLPPAEQDSLTAELGELAGADPEDSGMRSPEVRDLADAGFEIGFHTRRHHRLPPLSDGELERALREGRGEVEEAAGARISMIAYPHGAGDQRVAGFARAAGYRVGFTTRAEAATAATDPLLVGRMDAAAIPVGRFPGALATAAARAHSQ